MAKNNVGTTSIQMGVDGSPMMAGGEVFVPILRAAPLRRLVEAICGGASCVDITGLRPGGEKLHEELVSADESRRAVRRNGCYVVPPTVTAESWDAAPWLGDPVPDGFTYRSDTWPLQWTVDELHDLLVVKQESLCES